MGVTPPGRLSGQSPYFFYLQLRSQLPLANRKRESRDCRIAHPAHVLPSATGSYVVAKLPWSCMTVTVSMVKAIALLTLIQLLYTHPFFAIAEHAQFITNSEVASLYGRTLRSMPSSADSRSVVEGDVPDYEVVTTQYDDDAGQVNNARPQLSSTTAANASEEEECDLQQTEVNLYVWLFCLANLV